MNGRSSETFNVVVVVVIIIIVVVVVVVEFAVEFALLLITISLVEKTQL